MVMYWKPVSSNHLFTAWFEWFVGDEIFIIGLVIGRPWIIIVLPRCRCRCLLLGTFLLSPRTSSIGHDLCSKCSARRPWFARHLLSTVHARRGPLLRRHALGW